MEATQSLLRERDADKVTAADVADVAQVSVATVYNLVGTRERVLSAVLDDYVDRLASAVGAEDTPSDLVEAVVEVIRLATMFSLDDPLPLRAVLKELGPLELAENQRVGLGSVLAPLTGELTAGTAGARGEELTRMLVYGYRGVLMSWVYGLVDDDGFRADAETMTRQLLTGWSDREQEGKVGDG